MKSFNSYETKILERLGIPTVSNACWTGMMIGTDGPEACRQELCDGEFIITSLRMKKNHVIYIDKEKTSFDMIANYQDLRLM